MNKPARLVSIVLALTLVNNSLLACNSDLPNVNTHTEPDTTEPVAADSVTEPDTEFETETDPETESEVNVNEHMELTSAVRIFSPTDRNRNLRKTANTLIERIQAKTGIRLTVAYADDGDIPAESEIVLGYAPSRKATVDAYNTVEVGEYGVYAEGNNAVLIAWDDEDISAAADLFVDTCLYQEGDRWFIQPATVAADESTPDAVALSAYRIVYAADADDTIVNTLVPRLRQYLLDTYGVSVPAVSDSEAPHPYELVIGNTNRTTDEIQAYLEGASALQPSQRAIIPVENKFFLLGDRAGSIALAVSLLTDRLETHLIGQGNVLHPIAPISLPAGGEAYVSAPMVTTDRAEVAEGAHLRIMSYNILNQDYVPDNPLPPERDEQFADILLYYMPDVVGIQEANLAWHESFDMLFGLSGAYLPACRYHDGKNTTQTTFLYNPQTVKLIDEYVIHYTDWDDSDIRVVSFAVFEDLADGHRFVMTNTHPAPHAQYYSGHMAELNRILTEELAKYEGLPVIMTGDFNTRESQAEYNTLMATQGVRDARYDEGVELVRNTCTYTHLPSGEAIGGAIMEANNNNIDHIFINGQVQAKLFNVVVDHDAANISDHLPIYADVILK